MQLEVPASLRRWFVAHFVVDLLVALPLLLVPQQALGLLGWTYVDVTTTRIVGAALLAIGTQSLLGRHASAEVFTAMLNLKIIWSLTAIVGLVASIGEGAPPAAWAFLGAFITFSGVWIHHRIRFKQLAGASDSGEALKPG